MGYSSLGEAIPQLANLTSYAPSALATRAGGQNFTHCCLVAMNQSLNVDGPNGSLSFNTPSYFLPSMTIPDLESAISGSSFPCGASWNGPSDPGAPVVRVSYDWCLSQCGGWEISHVDVLSQWIGPLVQFILPSLAFCLNVPRVSKVAIPDGVFQAHPRSLRGFATYWARLGWALVLMTADTFIWLSVCFAFAGPMLLSAVYEFILDRKVLEFLSPPREKKKRERPAISNRLKAQLLVAVVVGNLRLSTGRRSSTINSKIVRSDQDPGLLRRYTSTATIDPLRDNTWSRIMTMVDEAEEDRIFGKIFLSTKLKAILNSQARSVTVAHQTFENHS